MKIEIIYMRNFSSNFIQYRLWQLNQLSLLQFEQLDRLQLSVRYRLQGLRQSPEIHGELFV